MTDYLVIAGATPEAARATAQKVLALETRVAKKKLTPLEKRDPAKRFVPMPYADAQRLLSNVDLDAYFRSLGLPTGGEVVVVEVEALRERNAIFAESWPEETRTYLQFELLRQMAPYLHAGLRCAGRRVQRRALRQGCDAAACQAGGHGHAQPARSSAVQLYVAKYMTPESRREVEAMVAP